MNSILERPAFTVTVGELVEALKDSVLQESPNKELQKKDPPKIIYSIRALAEELHVSLVTAQRIKNRVRHLQTGRKVWFNMDEVYEDLAKTTNKFKVK